MTKPQKTHINAGQANVLQALRNDVNQDGLTHLRLQEVCEMCRTVMVRHMLDLREYALVVELEPPGVKKAALWGISMAGRRALADYDHKLDLAATRAMRVAPPSRSIWGTHYTPPSNVYYRNNGNRHIASAGVLC